MKRIITLLLTVVLILSLTVPTFADGTVEKKTYGEILFDLGIILGSNGDLKEGDLITREEMVTILTRLIEEDTDFTPPANPTFKDVPTSHWAYENIELAYSKGITSGIGNGLFGLGDKINYNQAALFLIRSLGYDTSHIDYNNAAAVIAEEYGLKLEEAEQGFKELIRGQVFELLAKTLDMPTKDNPSKSKVELLNFDSEALETFKAAVKKAVPYKLEEKEVEPTAIGDLSEFPLKELPNIDKEAYLQYLKKNPDEQNALELIEKDIERMKTYVNKYLTVDYRVLEITDSLIEELNSYPPGFLAIDIKQDGDDFHTTYNGVLIALSRDGDQLTIKFTVSSLERFAYSEGYVTEIREYNYGNGLKVYAILGQEKISGNVYDDFYVSLVVDAEGKLYEGIGKASHGIGYTESYENYQK